jgi:hypothetical protein
VQRVLKTSVRLFVTNYSYFMQMFDVS